MAIETRRETEDLRKKARIECEHDMGNAEVL